MWCRDPVGYQSCTLGKYGYFIEFSYAIFLVKGVDSVTYPSHQPVGDVVSDCQQL